MMSFTFIYYCVKACHIVSPLFPVTTIPSGDVANWTTSVIFSAARGRTIPLQAPLLGFTPHSSCLVTCIRIYLHIYIYIYIQIHIYCIILYIYNIYIRMYIYTHTRRYTYPQVFKASPRLLVIMVSKLFCLSQFPTPFGHLWVATRTTVADWSLKIEHMNNEEQYVYTYIYIVNYSNIYTNCHTYIRNISIIIIGLITIIFTCCIYNY
jgi:hypothetical protein